MTWLVHILRDGALEKTIELGPGEHAIGRGEDNRVVLADKAVSAKHAALTIDEKGALLRDAGSRNGVLLAGEKIEEMRFADAFEVQIGPYALRAAPKTPAPAKPAGKALLPLVYLLMITLTGAVALLNALPQFASFTDFRDREVLKRGILLARYLAEINAHPLQNHEYDQTRALPVSQEEGVLFAYVTDASGKILAPASDLGKSLDKPPYDAGLKERTLKVWDAEKGHKIIFYPIKNRELFIGAAVLGYDVGRATELLDHGSEKWILLLFLSLGCGVLAAFWLLRLFAAPLVRLAEEIGICLKERRDALDFPTRAPELMALVDACNRLLLLAARPAQAATAASAPGPKTDAGGPAPTPGHDDPNTAWCRLDLDSHRVLDHNDAFSRLPGAPAQAKGLHLLEVFADPELLQTVSGLLEETRPDAEATSAGERAYLVSKRVDPAAPLHLVLTFTEAAHG